MLADRGGGGGCFPASFLNIYQNKTSNLSSALNKMKVCVVAVVALSLSCLCICDWTARSV